MTTRNHRVRFMTDNLMAAQAASVSFSSAKSGFPGANVLTDYRFEQWITGGNFTIGSTNNKIYINDGTDRTITLTSGNYTYATLAAHVQTQLNASSSNWTCTYSTSTGKFTIDRSSGTEVLRFSQTTDAAWDTLGFTGSVDDNSGPFVSDEQRNHTDEHVTVDFGSPVEIQAFIAIAKLSEVFGLSSEATVTLMFNTTDSWTAPALTVTLTPTSLGIVKFLDDQADTTYQYMRFKFVDRENTVGPEGFKFSNLFAGGYTTILRRNIVRGFEWSVVDPSEVSRAEGGAEFFNRRTKFHRFDGLSIVGLDADDRRGLQQIFWDLGQSTPFYLAIDPLANVSENTVEMTKYVRFDGDPRFSHVKGDVYSMAFAVKEIVG